MPRSCWVRAATPSSSSPRRSGCSRIAEYHYDLGDVYGQQEKWQDAMREFETALRLEPANPQFQTAIAQVFCACEMPSRALEIMEKVVRAHPDDEVFRFYLALALHDSSIEAMSEFVDGHLPTSEAQVTLAERNVERIAGMRLNDSEVDAMVANLRELIADARKPRWVRSRHVGAYFLLTFVLAGISGAGQEIGITLFMVIGLPLIIWLYVVRHRKQAWQHRAKLFANQIVKQGI